MSGIDELGNTLKELIETQREILKHEDKLRKMGERIKEYFTELLGDYLRKDMNMSIPVRQRILKGGDYRLIVERVDIRTERWNQKLTISLGSDEAGYYDIDLTINLEPDNVLFIVENLEDIIDILKEALEKKKKELTTLKDRVKKAVNKVSELAV